MLCLFLLVIVSSRGHGQVTAYIDPFLGTEGGGNVSPGPSLPFGMVKPGPDVGANTGNAGWLHDGNINGFSQTHVSGTGGGSSGPSTRASTLEVMGRPSRNTNVSRASPISSGFWKRACGSFGSIPDWG